MNYINMETVRVKFERLHKDAKIPTKATPDRAYYDVYSVAEVDLTPEKVFMVHTGLKVQPITGWFIDIRPRSGLAKDGVTINNSPGTLDCDYGGELMIELIWHNNVLSETNWDLGGDKYEKIPKYHIKKGDRIAQICVMPMYEIEWIEQKIEGTSGFGSTGK